MIDLSSKFGEQDRTKFVTQKDLTDMQPFKNINIASVTHT